MAGSVETVFARMLRRLLNARIVWVSAAFFLCLAGAAFVRALFAAEGSALVPAGVWAVSALPCVSVLAALVSMRLWSEDRASGYLDTLLVAPVTERAYAIGRFLAAFLLCAVVLFGHLVATLLILRHYAPSLAPALGFGRFLPAYLGLLFPLAGGTALGAWFSVATKHAAAAATMTLLVVLALPIAAFEAATAWVPSFRAVMTETPFTTFARHAAEGLFSLSGVVFYVAGTCAALFACSKTLASVRFRGSGGRGLRWSGRVAVLLAWTLAALLCGISYRFDITLALPGTSGVAPFPETTRNVLADMSGTLKVTCFVARSAPSHRAAAHLAEGLAAEARRRPGVRVSVRFVDPRWDLAEATQLVASGCAAGSLVFECGHRRIIVKAEGADVSSCVAALARLARPAGRETVCWTTGHGEAAFDDYDAVTGMSDAARAFARTGFRFASLDLARVPAVPEDCAFLAVMAPRAPFSEAERLSVEGYLKKGGRLLAVSGPGGQTGLDALLASRGLLKQTGGGDVPTVNGSDLLVRTFADHPVTRTLAGSTLVFGADAVTWMSADDGGVSNRVDAARFTPLASASGRAFAAALEYGGALAEDLVLRPMRIVAVGDPSFAVNASVARRANANVTFLLKAAAWLSGFETILVPDADTNVLATGMDRRARAHFSVRMCLIAPLVALALALLACLRRMLLS